MDAFASYLALIKKVDAFTTAVRAAYPERIACAPGCDDCCKSAFTLSLVEAQNLLIGFDALTPKEKDVAVRSCRNAKSRGPCPLLYGGLCMLYSHRPIICRTHGLPFKSSHLRINGLEVTSFCDMNFAGPGVSALRQEHILNLDLVNETLSAINRLFMKELGLEGGAERVHVTELFVGRTA